MKSIYTCMYSSFRKLKEPKSIKQLKYVNSLNDYNKSITISTGPAGCGKTLFACQEAAKSYTDENHSKIILTRPTIAVDEDLGYLPGSMHDKLAPWIRPMIDILSTYFTESQIENMIYNDKLEIAPLSYMRGRTFENSFVIGDEMQNSTKNQMKMLLTRIGTNSKMVIIGDPLQSDLKEDVNGLCDLISKVDTKELKYIDYIRLDDNDVQRSEVVIELLNDVYNV